MNVKTWNSLARKGNIKKHLSIFLGKYLAEVLPVSFARNSIYSIQYILRLVIRTTSRFRKYLRDNHNSIGTETVEINYLR